MQVCVLAPATESGGDVGRRQFRLDGGGEARVDHGVLKRDLRELLGHPHRLERRDHVGDPARLIGEPLFDDVDALLAAPTGASRDAARVHRVHVVPFRRMRPADVIGHGLAVEPALNAATQGARVRLVVRVAQAVRRDHLDRRADRAVGVTRPIHPLGGRQHLAGIDEAPDREPDEAGHRVHARRVDPGRLTLEQEVVAGLDDLLEIVGPGLRRAQNAPVRLGVQAILGADDAILVQRDSAGRVAVVHPHVAATGVGLALAGVDQLVRRQDRRRPLHGLAAGALSALQSAAESNFGRAGHFADGDEILAH